MTTLRRILPPRRFLVTQKARVANQRTVYLAVHDDPSPAEVFVRVKGSDCTAQYGAPLEKIGDLLLGAKFEPAGPVQDHPRIKNCSSLPDLIGRHLLIECCGREDLAHLPAETRL